MSAPGVVLFTIALLVVTALAFLILRVLLDMRQRIIITVARPTTTDGESCQITSNIRASADSPEIAAVLEKASLSIQHRVVHQNEIMLKAQTAAAHGKWLKIKRKIDDNFKLSAAERRWWHEFGENFDASGPKVDAKEAVVRDAAESPNEQVEE